MIELRPLEKQTELDKLHVRADAYSFELSGLDAALGATQRHIETSFLKSLQASLREQEQALAKKRVALTELRSECLKAIGTLALL